MDTSGKGGAIRKAFEGLDPAGRARRLVQGAHRARSWPTTSCGGSTPTCPPTARSPSSTAATTRTCSSSGSTTWCRRRAGRPATTHIRNFEQMLADEGTVIRKFFLHISKDEQADAPAGPPRQPAPSTGSSARRTSTEREHWDDYQDAYEEAIRRTATPDAPWIVVPADRKWYRDLVICRTHGRHARGPRPALPRTASTTCPASSSSDSGASDASPTTEGRCQPTTRSSAGRPSQAPSTMRSSSPGMTSCGPGRDAVA